MACRYRHRGTTHGSRANPDEIPVVHQRIDRRHGARDKQRRHYGNSGAAPLQQHERNAQADDNQGQGDR